MADRLRGPWDLSDLDGTEARLREQPVREPDDAGRAEVLTQLARVEGLRARFAEGEEVLVEAARQAEGSPVVRARVELQRGRLLRSAGDDRTALPLFEEAFQSALEAGEEFVAVDAAHMAALAAEGDAFGFHEELAECYAALGREDEAREHAALATSLLDDTR